MTPLTPHKRDKALKASRIVELTSHYASQPTPPQGLVVSQGKFDSSNCSELHPKMQLWEKKNRPAPPDCGYSECPDYIDWHPGCICLLGDIEGFLSLFRIKD